jgi:hypothetical protein
VIVLLAVPYPYPLDRASQNTDLPHK